jgi:membrane fusion protein, heavy metal efflux system
MKNMTTPALLALLLAMSPGVFAAESHGEDHDGDEHADPVKGPHGGRLLQDGEFALELTIFETGVEPQFRAYAYRDDAALAPSTVSLAVTLTRLGGAVNRFAFAPEADYLLGDGVVHEPHSFVVAVTARHDGSTYDWSYDSFEGRTSIAQASAAASSIRSETAGAATVRETLVLHGIVVPDPARVFQLRARYPGIVKAVHKRLGEPVAAGDVLLVIEANESLQRYNVVAPSAGVVVRRDVNAGMVAGDETLLTIADLSAVWVELAAFQHDLDKIQAGQAVTISDVDGHQTATGVVDSLAPVGSPASQSMTVRVIVDNAGGRWRPGLFVTGEVAVAQTPVPVAVRRSALQSFRDWTVVFEQVGDEFEVRPVTLGRGDDVWIEVLAGLDAGARYVTDGSYLVKADIEKSGASHDH